MNRFKFLEHELNYKSQFIDNKICRENCTLYLVGERIDKQCETCEDLKNYWWGLQQSLIPEKLQTKIELKPENVDILAYNTLNDYRKNIMKNVRNGVNLYLFSEGICGNGKTSWAIKLIKTYLFNISNQNKECKALFIRVPELLLNFRLDINHPTNKFFEIVEMIKTVDLVVWDDIGSTATKDFDYQSLFTLIDIRVSSKLSNIFTSNLTKEKLVKVFDDRIVSRIYTNSARVQFRGGDRRGV